MSNFITEFNKVSKDVCDNAKLKGFWDNDKVANCGTKIALMHSELSEALEALRIGNKPDEHIPEFLNIEVELADTIIRIMDYAYFNNYKVGAAIIAKSEYNKNRPIKHGKNF